METKQTKITITNLLPYYKEYMIVTFKSDELDPSNTEEEHKLVLKQENVFNHPNTDLPAEYILVHNKYFNLGSTYILPV